ncbi:hypothetical protein [Glaciihabitans sp. dw_435]|uniref:hypothetical protein n=1 Tax=Glaciihabitans sp. dw_435 TaxID=2720081 RepID=UPI001BD2B135|nr:hypothetical protein [Glaciihabitans sp. dw_435]
MPSYRVMMTVGAMRPGVSPAVVLPAAAAAAAEFTIVEASDVAVVAGAARLTVRFMADDPELALQIGEHVTSVTASLARVDTWAVTERVQGRWIRV